jgi:hypothetical protein
LLHFREINMRLAAGAGCEDIQTYLDGQNVDAFFGLMAFDAHHAYHHEPHRYGQNRRRALEVGTPGCYGSPVVKLARSPLS